MQVNRATIILENCDKWIEMSSLCWYPEKESKAA